MSILSRIRESRQQAKAHNAKLADQRRRDQEQAVPYKHVPTHAAADAFASAPPSWREGDRIRIAEMNRRRSQMAAKGHQFTTPALPRFGSSRLSCVSYPGADSTISPGSFASICPFLDRDREGASSIGLDTSSSFYSTSSSYFSTTTTNSSSSPSPHSSPFMKASMGSRPLDQASRRKDSAPNKGERKSVEISLAGFTDSGDDRESPSSPWSAAASARSTHRMRYGCPRRSSQFSLDRPTMADRSSRGSGPPPSMRGFEAIGLVPATATRERYRRRRSGLHYERPDSPRLGGCA